MTNEEILEQLVKKLTPPRRTWWEGLVEKVVSALIMALTLGFFCVLWTKSSEIDRKLNNLSDSTKSTEDVLGNNIGQLQLQVGQLQEHMRSANTDLEKAIEAYGKALEAHKTAIEDLRGKIDKTSVSGTGPKPSPSPLPDVPSYKLSTIQHPAIWDPKMLQERQDEVRQSLKKEFDMLQSKR